MCQLKSGLILKDQIFIPDYDSHSQMLDELKIEDNEKNASTKFIRAELYPKNGDIFSPIDTWIFHVDQDILPDWYVPKYDEERMRKAVKEWADKHILVDVKNVELNGGIYYIKNATVEAYDSATVRAYNSATVKAYDSATVRAYNSATVKAYDSATVEAYDSATVRAYNSATVRAYDFATAIIPEFSSNNRDNIVITENATIKDCKTKTIWQSGDWKMLLVGGEPNE